MPIGINDAAAGGEILRKKGGEMKRLWLVFVLLALAMPAYADWVDITQEITVTASDPTTVGDVTTVTVTIANTADDFIEGSLRLSVTPADGAPVPINADSQNGQELIYYFDLITSEEDLFDQAETVTIAVAYAASDAIESAYVVELNDESVDSDIFRKKISKTPEFFSGEGAIQVMPVYVPARNTKGVLYKRDEAEELVLCGEYLDDDGNYVNIECTDDDIAMVKPIIVTYLQEEERVPFNSVPDYFVEDENGDWVPGGDRYAHDVYAAVSYDEGLTWKRKNISRTSRKSSFTLPNGVEYPGDSERQDLAVAGNFVMVTWVDKFCRSGNPWDMADADDLYQVTGPQKSVDYLDVHGDDDPRPDLGVRPFSCVWSARGVLEMDPERPNYGEIVWYKAEQLSTARRDAYRNFTAAVDPIPDNSDNGLLDGTGGFAVSWQEDPKGLKTGKGRGPGAGMSGACVNHKTDVWYSYLNWSDFAAVDPDFIQSDGTGDGDPTGGEDGNAEYLCTGLGGDCTYVYDPEVGDPDRDILPGTQFVDLPNEWTCPVCSAAKDTFEKDIKPHPLHTMSPPVRITDNAVCQERIPEAVWGYLHDPDIIEEPTASCDYTYEGGTSKQPILWEDLFDDWACPKCGEGKDSFVYGVIKNKHVGMAYCDWYADTPRVNRDDEYVDPMDPAFDIARYSLPGEWIAVEDPEAKFDGGPDAVTYADGKAYIGETEVRWSGDPLDGNTGASRANLSLVNWDGETLAIMAYEETKGIGEGSDKEANAPEQKTPLPISVAHEEDGTLTVVQGPYTNAKCVDCHYNGVVPVDRVVPKFSELDCAAVNGVWKGEIEAYYPYSPYPYEEGDVLDLTYSKLTRCVKFEEGLSICPKDSSDPDCVYRALPTHLPGWHSAVQDCVRCHLPYMTKDLDEDGVMDRVDLCLGTPLDEVVDTDPGSTLYGCSDTQDPTAADDSHDKRIRHGKNIYYHNFAFNLDRIYEQVDSDGNLTYGFGALTEDTVAYLKDHTIQHGHLVNQPNPALLWPQPPAEGGKPYHENARRVRVVPNEILDSDDPGAVITLGLLYKQGIGGQGAPADAILQLFRGGFDPEHIIKKDDTDGPMAWNLSSSTPLSYKVDYDEDGNVITYEDDKGHKTPKVEEYEWTDANLTDGTGWKIDENDLPVMLRNDGTVDLQYDLDGNPVIAFNPYENVFSSRLAIRGDTVLAGYAYCANWSAGKKAKDHYDFYIRVSRDDGETWTQPINVSQLKNHEESVSDCRVMLTPGTIEPFGAFPVTAADISQNGAPEIEDAGDVNNPDRLFVAVGTKLNTPQPNPNDEELEEAEEFLDLFYARGIILDEDKDSIVEGVDFETVTKENPKYVEGSLEFLYPDETPTEFSYHCIDDFGDWQDASACDEAEGIPNEPNPAYPEFVEEFDWLAKGDATQGDVQITCNPMGTKLYTIWEQELPLDDDAGQQHFRGADVWFRTIDYPDPEAAEDGDVNGDGELTWADGRLIKRNIGTTAYDPDFLWEGDYVSDFRITGQDYRSWKKIYIKERLSKLRKRWKSR